MSHLSGIWTEVKQDTIGEEEKARLLIKWRRDPYHNPINNRPIKPGSKKWKELVSTIGGDPILPTEILQTGPTDPLQIENLIAEQQRKSDAGYVAYITGSSSKIMTNIPQSNSPAFSYQTSVKHVESALVYLNPPQPLSMVQPALPDVFNQYLPRHKLIDRWGC